jgi:hypothetical protein
VLFDGAGLFDGAEVPLASAGSTVPSGPMVTACGAVDRMRAFCLGPIVWRSSLVNRDLTWARTLVAPLRGFRLPSE